jgi:molybdate transport system ATP-binding protein
MTLEVEIRHRLSAFALDVRFEAEGRLVALFGRSGSGKTSIVNVIAGLLAADHAIVRIGGETLVDTTRGVSVPRHKRRIGYVFQEARLFPHLTVRRNLLYGRWFAGGKADGTEFARVVDMLGIGPLLERWPANLSGGERQRVAIGRALLAAPRLLLMDEPLASLDEARKADILPYVERLRDASRIPIVYVSHSIAEVSRLSSDLVLLSDGKVVAVGPTAEIMSRLDLFPLTGRAEAGALIDAVVAHHDETYGLTEVVARSGRWSVPRVDLPIGTRLRFRVRARDVTLAATVPSGLSTLNIVAGVVAEVGGGSGPVVDVRLDCGGDTLLARVTRRSVATLGLQPGTSVHALVKSVALDRRSVGGPLPGATSDGDA